MRAMQYGARAPSNLDLVWAQIRAGHDYYNRLIEIERWRRLLHAVGTIDAKELAAQAVRDARAACGAYWGTYLLIEEAVQRAAKSVAHFRAKRDGKCPCGAAVAIGDWIEVATHRIVGCTRCGPALGFHRWRNDGRIGVQLQGGLSVPDLLSGRDRRARLRRDPGVSAHHPTTSAKRWLLDIRVGSEGRDPIWATVPVRLHRALPSDGRVKWIVLHARCVGTDTDWSITISVEGAHGSELPAPDLGAAGVDVDIATGTVAWIDEHGTVETFALPARLDERMRKTYDLHSIRGQHFAAVVDVLRQSDRGPWPAWLHDAARRFSIWLDKHAIGQLDALALHWRANRFDGDAELHSMIESWRVKNRHLYAWESHRRGNALRERRERYRLLAVRLARHSTVAVRQVDLSKWARRKDISEEQGQRQLAAPHELLDCIHDAVKRAGGEYVEVPEDTPPGAHEILRAVLEQRIAAPRSRAKAPVAPGETPAAKRRAAGLATRRAKRSQRGTEGIGIIE